MLYIECPQKPFYFKRSLFVAGGISNYSDWQQELRQLLKNVTGTFVNPRRKNFNNISEKEQISWEYEMLCKCTVVSFWFPAETVCPITLFELGSQLNRPGRNIFIGVHPNYQRKNDVVIQTELIRPDISVVYSLEDLVDQISTSSLFKSCNGGI